jgi:hypothetical protein
MIIEKWGTSINAEMETLIKYTKHAQMSFSSFFLIQNKRIGRMNRSCLGEVLVAVVKGVNIVQILCTHVYKWRNDTC